MRIPLLLIGKGGTTSVHGKKQSMATKALKALRRAESEGRLMICWVNESFTSKVIKNPFIYYNQFLFTCINLGMLALP
jgi:hypothetical protein